MTRHCCSVTSYLASIGRNHDIVASRARSRDIGNERVVFTACTNVSAAPTRRSEVLIAQGSYLVEVGRAGWRLKTAAWMELAIGHPVPRMILGY